MYSAYCYQKNAYILFLPLVFLEVKSEEKNGITAGTLSSMT
jgi:hypothetical protein